MKRKGQEGLYWALWAWEWRACVSLRGEGFSGRRVCAGRELRCVRKRFGCESGGCCVSLRGEVSPGGEDARDGDCVVHGNSSVAGVMGCVSPRGKVSPGGEGGGEVGTGTALRAGTVRLRERWACISLRGEFFRAESVRGGGAGTGTALRVGTVRLRERWACVLLRGSFLRAGNAEAEQETGIVLRVGTVRLRERRACVSLRGSFFGRRVCAVAERKCKAVYGYALESFGRGSGGRVFDAGGFSCARGRCARRKTSAMAAALFLKIPLRHEGVRSCGKETT